MTIVASAALSRGLVVALCAAGLAGCQTTGDVPSPAPVAGPVASAPAAGPAPSSGPVYSGGPSTGYGYGRGPFGGAAPAAPGLATTSSQPTWQRTNVSTQQSVGADGTVRTETTRTSVSFDANRAAGALAGLAASAGPSRAYVGLPGEWQMQADSNRSICRVTLYGSIESTEGAASSTGCSFGAPGQGITGWRYDGQSLYLLKPGAQPFRMMAAGPNRFDGSASLAFLTVRYALFR